MLTTPNLRHHAHILFETNKNLETYHQFNNHKWCSKGCNGLFEIKMSSKVVQPCCFWVPVQQFIHVTRTKVSIKEHPRVWDIQMNLKVSEYQNESTLSTRPQQQQTLHDLQVEETRAQCCQEVDSHSYITKSESNEPNLSRGRKASSRGSHDYINAANKACWSLLQLQTCNHQFN